MALRTWAEFLAGLNKTWAKKNNLAAKQAAYARYKAANTAKPLPAPAYDPNSYLGDEEYLTGESNARLQRALAQTSAEAEYQDALAGTDITERGIAENQAQQPDAQPG